MAQIVKSIEEDDEEEIKLEQDAIDLPHYMNEQRCEFDHDDRFSLPFNIGERDEMTGGP